MKTKILAASGFVLGTGLGAAHLALTVKHHRDTVRDKHDERFNDLVTEDPADGDDEC